MQEYSLDEAIAVLKVEGEERRSYGMTTSPDGRWVLMDSSFQEVIAEKVVDRNVLELWDLSTPSSPVRHRTIDIPPWASLPDLCFDRDSRRFAGTRGFAVFHGDIDGDVHVEETIDVNGGISFLPGGELLLHERSPYVYAPGHGPSRSFEDRKIPLDPHSLAVSPDGAWAASVNMEPYVRLWDVATGTQIKRLNAIGFSFALSVAFSNDGQSLAYGGARDKGGRPGHTITIVSVSRKSPVQATLLTGSWGDVRDLAFTPDDSALLVSQSTHVQVWDWRRGELRAVIRPSSRSGGKVKSMTHARPVGGAIAVLADRAVSILPSPPP